MKVKVFLIAFTSLLLFSYNAASQETAEPLAQGELTGEETGGALETDVTAESAEDAESSESEDSCRYIIASSQYISKGITKTFVLERSVPVRKDIVFESRRELETYLDNLKQSLENTRLLENIDIQYTCSEPDSDGIVPVAVTITVSDSQHILGLPKPSYDSNSGVELKLKLKDTNFLGFMNTLNFDFNGRIGSKDNPWDITDSTSKPPFILGTNFDYELPFNVGITRNSWSHDFSFDWEIGKSKPEFSYATGLTVGIPFAQNTLNLNFTQSIVRNDDYEELGDDLYLVEAGSISLPLTIGLINNITKVTYTPTASVSYNWDKDKISPLNEDLRGPELKIKQTIATEAVNWHGNMRTGLSFSGTQTFAWNFQSKVFTPQVSGEVKLYKAFKYVGLNADLYFYAMLNSSQNTLGQRLRGILDNQYYLGTDSPLLKTDAALQFSFDMPIHIITTDWGGWGRAMFGPYEEMTGAKKKFFWLPHKMARYLNFELQISPFVDAALIKNKYTNRFFSFKDGLYDAGVEVLVFPLSWKSFVIRGSVGFDVSRLLLKDFVDMSYRDTSVKPYEIFIGLGLQF